jgi:agmatine deiminase
MGTQKKTPAVFGYRMPAEWEPQRAVWMSWPYNSITWEKHHLTNAEDAFTEIISTILRYEDVELLVPNDIVRKRAEKRLKSIKSTKGTLRIHEIESGDIWFRDYGPLFVTAERNALRGSGEKAVTKWTYNAYGNKYEDLLIGNEVPNGMPIKKLKRFDTNIVLEGGSIDVNGTGTLITTESCLLSPDRNPHLTKAQIEDALKNYLGVTNVLWLSAGIEGDDTTGHVDDLTRFVGPSTVITVVEEDPADPNYKPLKENEKRLKKMKDERGKPLTVIELPMPKPFVVEGRRMAATYANFLIINEAVLVPVYRQPSDTVALEILSSCFPKREIVPIDCTGLIWGYGSIHCATMQEPT